MSPHSPPKVSVVIPAHNAEPWIRETVRSVLCQTVRNIELIVVNDGSTDATSHAAQAEAAKLDGSVTIINCIRQGVSRARNTGWRRASGNLVAFLDADDLWHPRKIELQLRELDSKPSLAAVGCDFEVFEDSSRRIVDYVSCDWDSASIYKWLLLEKRGVLLPSTLLVKKHVLEGVGGFDPELSIASDLDLAWRLATAVEVGNLHAPLARYRLSSSQMHRNTDLLRHDYSLLFNRVPFVVSPAASRRVETNLDLLDAQRAWKSRAGLGGGIKLLRLGLAHPISSIRGLRRTARQRRTVSPGAVENSWAPWSI